METKPHVLLLDDEPLNLGQLEQLLGADVEFVRFVDPLAALTWCQQHRPDMCLVDYRMPGIDGLEFLRRVRHVPEFESVPIVVVTTLAEKAICREALALGAVDFITKPYPFEETRLRLRNLLALRGTAATVIDAPTVPVVPAAAHEATLREQILILRKLSRLSCSRDEETDKHLRRVAGIARLIGRALGQDEEFCTRLFLAAPMHDVGKAGIPDRILLKRDKLNAEEWEIMKSHTRIGYELLKDSQSSLMRMGAEIALTHHEKYNGRGYPNGLAGTAIPLAGRIVAVADCLDALLSVRSYKEAWSVQRALQYLWRERGKHLDPHGVDAVFKNINEILEIERRHVDETRQFAHDYDRVLPRAAP
ncbi:MAG: response regulator [Gammaproteobacteria bacterium]|nr:response regulator [Gammaproteobacteria bacterium]